METLKFYVHFESPPEFTMKVEWDANDNQGNVLQLINKFTGEYNKNWSNKRTLTKDNINIQHKGNTLPHEAIVSKSIEPASDLYAILEDKKLTCGHSGCGNEYYEKDNNEDSCQYHPGPPIFHEGYKGWRCCNFKSSDFDEFLQTKGCKIGRHVPKISEPKKPIVQQSEVPRNVRVISNDQGVEVYKNTQSTATPIAPMHKPKEKKERPQEQPDPPDAVIPLGTSCIHNGCNSIFKGDASRTQACRYHPGFPIFHEGSKGWDCCRQMTLDFDDFLSLEGCTDGLHKFIKEKKDAVVNVRHDWYQTMDSVICCFYAKNVNKDNTIVTFEKNKLDVKIQLEDGNIFTKQLQLFRDITPEHSKYTILSTKIEIKLIKAYGGDWSKLSV